MSRHRKPSNLSWRAVRKIHSRWLTGSCPEWCWLLSDLHGDFSLVLTGAKISQGPPPENDVEAATLIPNGSPPITCITFPTCCAHYPGGSSGCICRLLPHSRGLPQMAGGSASALTLSRPAQASHTLRPVGLLSRPRRPLSRRFSPAGYPTKPLASYQIYRLLSGWNLPPLVIHAFGAHGHNRS